MGAEERYQEWYTEFHERDNDRADHMELCRDSWMALVKMCCVEIDHHFDEYEVDSLTCHEVIDSVRRGLGVRE